jgi:hypothetical protein
LSALYLDSSAFVMLVVEEAETPALRAFFAGIGARRASSALLRTEALALCVTWARMPWRWSARGCGVPRVPHPKVLDTEVR